MTLPPPGPRPGKEGKRERGPHDGAERDPGPLTSSKERPWQSSVPRPVCAFARHSQQGGEPRQKKTSLWLPICSWAFQKQQKLWGGDSVHRIV